MEARVAFPQTFSLPRCGFSAFLRARPSQIRVNHPKSHRVRQQATADPRTAAAQARGRGGADSGRFASGRRPLWGRGPNLGLRGPGRAAGWQPARRWGGGARRGSVPSACRAGRARGGVAPRRAPTVPECAVTGRTCVRHKAGVFPATATPTPFCAQTRSVGGRRPGSSPKPIPRV